MWTQLLVSKCPARPIKMYFKPVIQNHAASLRSISTLEIHCVSSYSGIAVLRLSGRASHSELLAAVSTFAKALETETIVGKLWIVEIGRIRIYRPEDES